MNEMTRDYRLLPPAFLDGPVYVNPTLRELALYLLESAAIYDAWRVVTTGRGTSEVKCAAGQIVTSRNAIAYATGQTSASVASRLSRLVAYGFCTIEARGHCSIITIANWPEYVPYLAN